MIHLQRKVGKVAFHFDNVLIWTISDQKMVMVLDPFAFVHDDD